MGFTDKMVALRSKMSGISEEESAEAKKKMRVIFNELVENGDKYHLIACYGTKTINVVVAKRTTYYSYIVGYDLNNGDMAVVPVNHDLTKSAEKPVKCTTADTKIKRSITSGEMVFENAGFEKGKERIQYFSFPNQPDYQIGVLQNDESTEFQGFIEKFYKG